MANRNLSVVSERLAVAICVFIVLFPKGGFKIGAVPITWGYLLIGAAVLFSLPFLLLQVVELTFRREALLVMVSVAPFLTLMAYAVVANGCADMGGLISNVVCFAVLPFAFLVCFPPFVKHMNVVRLLKLIRELVFLAAIYGIFLFIWHIVTGTYLEIPYLTVNIDDVGTLESTKHIDRGGLFKLISTYNNGNIYGVATLMLLPLFDCMETSRWRRALVRIALVLTLSRTVWIGLILYQGIQTIYGIRKDLRKVCGSRVKETVTRLILICYPIILIAGGLWFLSFSTDGVFSFSSFILDSSFGGRSAQLDVFSRATLLPSVASAGFGEIVYAEAAHLYGWTGLVSLLLILGAPIAVYCMFPDVGRNNRIARAAFHGLFLYMILAGSDGAMNYIPVMAFYWMDCMLFVNDGFGKMVVGKKNVVG